MKHTFARGVHPAGHKDLSASSLIGEMPVPEILCVALSQHIGAPAEPAVKPGDKVKMGGLLGRAAAGLSVPVYSPVSGVVKAIEKRMLPNGLRGDCVILENDGKDDEKRLPPLTDPTPEQILDRIREAGIVGMGGAGFPTAVKLAPKTQVDTLIINAAECEPYITCDYRVMLEYTEKLLQGTEYLRRALGVSRVLIGVESNKPDCVERIGTYLSDEKGNFEVVVCPVKYPQGAEKQLIYALTGRAVPVGGLPADVGVVVQNVHTALSVYYAVAEGQPLFRRVMTVTGHGCKTPANLWVRVGTPVRDIIEYCGLNATEDALAAAKERLDSASARLETEKSAKERDKNAYKTARDEFRAAQWEYERLSSLAVTKVVNGGPMMGTALASIDVATTKTTSCILLMTRADTTQPPTTACIGCGKCVASCPMRLVPNFIASFTGADDFEGAKKYGANECIQCGCCSYVCPARRPLVQTIAYARKKIKELKI